MNIGSYTDKNIVHSLIIYEWENKIDIIEMKKLFDEFSELFGIFPDYVTVSGSTRSFQYKYLGFNRRDVIHRQQWENLGYQWLRVPDNLYPYSAACSFSEHNGARVVFLVDDAFTNDAQSVLSAWLVRVVEALRPTYGFMHSKPYHFGPYEYVTGIHVENDEGTEEGIRRSEFGYVACLKNRNLDRKLRDIYPVNLIGQGHLDAFVEGKPLKSWILQGYRGNLVQIGEVTWKWSLEQLELIRVRKTMLDNGHLIVTV